MADNIRTDLVRSQSSGVPGRSLNTARHHHFVLDSPGGPNEALNNGEAFLASISSCGVTLIEKYAAEQGILLRGMEVAIEGARSQREHRFLGISVRFALRGVDQARAEHLVGVWRVR